MKLPDKNILAVFLLVFFLTLIPSLIMFYFPILYVDLGFSAFEIGLITALSMTIYLIIPAPAGLLCDRFDIRKIVLISLLLWIFFFFGMIHASGFVIILLLVMCFRSAALISKTALDSIILKIKQTSENKFIGNYLLFLFLGNSLGMLLGGILLDQFYFNQMFLLVAVSILVLAPFVFLLPKIKPQKIQIKSYSIDLLKPKPMLIFLVLFLFSLHFGAEYISYSLFLKENLSLTFSQIGLYMAVAIFFMAPTAFLSGRIINKSNAFMIFALAIFFSGLGHILMTQGGVYLSLLFRILHETGDALYFISFLVFLKYSFPKKRIGGNYGALTIATGIGSILGSFLFSFIGFEYGHDWSLIISGAIAILASFVLFSSLKIIKK